MAPLRKVFRRVADLGGVIVCHLERAFLVDFDRPLSPNSEMGNVLRVTVRLGEQTMSRRNIVIFAAGAFVLAGGLVLGLRSRAGTASPDPKRVEANRDTSDLRSLVNQDADRFSFERLKGRTVAMNFIFTHCPTSCPLQTRALAAVQRALPGSLRNRVQFVSVSMDPARDTPAVLKNYASSLGADLGNWSFVTGAQEEIVWLHQHFDAKVKRIDGGQFDHRVAVYLLDANGRFIQRYTGDLDQQRLAREIADVDSLYNKS